MLVAIGWYSPTPDQEGPLVVQAMAPEGPVEGARDKCQCPDARWGCQVLVACLKQFEELPGTGPCAGRCRDWGSETPRLRRYVTSDLAMNSSRMQINTSKQNSKR